MAADIYWVAEVLGGKLAILARPRPGDWLEDEIQDWKRQGIDVAVSLLEEAEASSLGLEREAHLCREQGIEFISFPVPDMQVPVSTSLTRS
jgi:hypothetical protein